MNWRLVLSEFAMSLSPVFLVGTALVAVGIGGFALTEGLHSSAAGRIDWVEKHAYEAFPETLADKTGDLVHVQGAVSVGEGISDPNTGVHFDALVVDRDVQIYQWVEDYEDKTYTDRDGQERKRRVYEYHRRWVSSPVRSWDFHDRSYWNTGDMPFRDATFKASSVKLDTVALSPELVRLTVSALGQQRLENGSPELSSLSTRWTATGNPNIGDIRVTYSVVKPSVVSVIAQYGDGTLKPFSAGIAPDSVGNGYADVVRGDKRLAEMLGSSRSSSGLFAWVFRVLSAGFLVVGAVLGWVNRPQTGGRKSVAA
jgi:hypothetical protein